MVTARELRVKLSLTDQDFKQQMNDINRVTNRFQKIIIIADQNLKSLQNTVNGFNVKDLSQQLNLSINENTLLQSIKDFVEKFNTRKRTIQIRASNAALKNSINEFIETSGNRFKKIAIKVREAVLRDSINDWIDKVEKGRAGLKKVPIKVDTTKDSSIVESLRKFFEKEKFDIVIDTKSMKKALEDFFAKYQASLMVTISEKQAAAGDVSAEANNLLKDILKIATEIKDSINNSKEIFENIESNTKPGALGGLIQRL